MEKRPVTEALELCMNQLGNMTRLKNILRNHLRSLKRSVTGEGKLPVTECLEQFISQLANMTKLKIFSRKH